MITAVYGRYGYGTGTVLNRTVSLQVEHIIHTYLFDFEQHVPSHLVAPHLRRYTVLVLMGKLRTGTYSTVRTQQVSKSGSGLLRTYNSYGWVNAENYSRTLRRLPY